MNKVILTALLSLVVTNSYAFDLDEYKEKLRAPMAKMLGMDRTNSILGAKATENSNSITLPQIPEVKLDAKNENFYDNKTSSVYSQGDDYNKLSNEEKRNFRIKFLNQLYFATRNSNPKQSDLLKSLNVLEQGGNREGVYRSVTLDQTYMALEQYEDIPSDALINFVRYFSPKYLRKTYEDASLRKLNLWSLKRLLTEKCLELVDVLAKKPDDLYRWYAVYSAELATNYPELWKSKTRANTSDQYHYRWAKKVPFQHIKSEIILKNHLLMNYLQKN